MTAWSWNLAVVLTYKPLEGLLFDLRPFHHTRDKFMLANKFIFPVNPEICVNSSKMKIILWRGGSDEPTCAILVSVDVCQEKFKPVILKE
jgi:hypothetical protein